MKTLFILVFTVATLIGCGGGSSSNQTEAIPKIINGVPKGDNFPEVNQIYINRRDSTWVSCSGSWIGAHKFLTAAHCVVELSGARVENDAVTVIMEVDGAILAQASSRIDVHPSYQPKRMVPSPLYPGLLATAYDIAVVSFPAPFLGETALLTDYPVARGDLLLLVGFGLTGDDESIGSSGQLGFTEVHQVDEYRIFWRFDGEGESNTCFGDSGGPAYVDLGNGPRLVGITSGGTRNDCAPGDLSFDTRVDIFLDWLTEVGGGELTIESAFAAAENN